MDLSRILSVLCLFLLAICLVFSVTALTALRNAVSETDRMRSDAESLLEELKKQPQESIPPEEDKESVPVDILYESFCMRECGGKIAIYTADGELVRILELPVETLPEADRAALQSGISLSSWKEVLALIEDYGG